MAVIPLIRQGVLAVTTVFAVIELAIAAHLIVQTQQYFGFTATLSALGVAVAVISLVTLPVMFVVDLIRRGAFTSMIVVELVWLFILSILWVAAAGETTSEFGQAFTNGCNLLSSFYNGLCQEVQVVEAFSFLNFIILLAYTVVVLVLALIAANRGQSVWFSSVKESFGSSSGQVEYPMTQQGTPAPPAQVIHQHATGVPQAGPAYGSPAV